MSETPGERITDDSGTVPEQPVPDPDAGPASDPEPARPETSPDPDTGPASDPEPEAPEE